MLKIKQPALYKNVVSRQCKLYDWLNIPIENMKLIFGKHPDPLKTPKKIKTYLKIKTMNITP